MAASRESLRLTDNYRRRIVALRRTTIAALYASWELDEDNLDRSFARWLAGAEVALSAAQRTAAVLADVYVAGFVGSELGVPSAPLGLDPGAFAGRSGDGRPLREALTPPLYTVKRAIGAGRPIASALVSGRARAVRTASVELDAAADGALDSVLIARDEVVGWRRVSSSGSCGACLAAVTGAVQADARPLLRHPHCRCTKEPVVAGVPDKFTRPTGQDLFDAMTAAEQNRLFAGRGGEAKAELLRSGKVTLEDLSTETRFNNVGARGGRGTFDPMIVETPLEELERRAGGR